MRYDARRATDRWLLVQATGSFMPLLNGAAPSTNALNRMVTIKLTTALSYVPHLLHSSCDPGMKGSTRSL